MFGSCVPEDAVAADEAVGVPDVAANFPVALNGCTFSAIDLILSKCVANLDSVSTIRFSSSTIF